MPGFPRIAIGPQTAWSATSARVGDARALFGMPDFEQYPEPACTQLRSRPLRSAAIVSSLWRASGNEVGYQMARKPGSARQTKEYRVGRMADESKSLVDAGVECPANFSPDQMRQSGRSNAPSKTQLDCVGNLGGDQTRITRVPRHSIGAIISAGAPVSVISM